MKNRRTQKAIILEYLCWVRQKARTEDEEWVKSYNLRSKDTMWGFIGSQGDRRARELYEEGKIDRRIVKKFSEYRYKYPEGRITIPVFIDNQEELNFNQSIG